MTDLARASADTLEACADALLTAAALAIVVAGREPTPAAARELAVRAIQVVLRRTASEGPKPREGEG